MASARPIPAFISEAAGADRGLICGFQLVHGARPREIAVDEMLDSLSRTDAVTWLHFNLGEVRARRWLQESEFLPLELRELLQELDDNRRIEAVDHGVLVVMSDFTYEDDSDPSEVAPLWCFATRSALITARMHPLKGVDDLRLAMRDGLTANSGVQLIVQLLEFRTSYLRRRAHEMIERLDDIEDEILAGSIRQQREQLGRTRRICARLRRQFVPERADLTRFLRRDATQMSEEDADALQSEAESLGFAIEEIAELYERAKLSAGGAGRSPGREHRKKSLCAFSSYRGIAAHDTGDRNIWYECGGDARPA